MPMSQVNEMRSALDLPETTAGIWAEFSCCGKVWFTVAWLAVHGRVACPKCGLVRRAKTYRREIV
jgi:hypothetical protein